MRRVTARRDGRWLRGRAEDAEDVCLEAAAAGVASRGFGAPQLLIVASIAGLAQVRHGSNLPVVTRRCIRDGSR